MSGGTSLSIDWRDVKTQVVATILAAAVLGAFGWASGLIGQLAPKAASLVAAIWRIVDYRVPIPVWGLLSAVIAAALIVWRSIRSRSTSLILKSRPQTVAVAASLGPVLSGRPDPSTVPAKLRSEKPRPDILPDSKDGRSWLRESAPEIAKQLAKLPPLKRSGVAGALFVGRWFRGEGTVVDVKEGIAAPYVQVKVTEGGDAFLNFSAADVYLIENFRAGDQIRFEGKVGKILDSGAIDLYSPRLLPSE